MIKKQIISNKGQVTNMSKKSKDKLILVQISSHEKFKECIENFLEEAGVVHIHAM